MAADGLTYFGDVLDEDVYAATHASVIEGDVFGEYTVTTKKLAIQKLLSPLGEDQVPHIRCVGMNYIKHAHELKMQIPTYPVIFFKPTTALLGPSDPIVVPSVCQIDGAKIDYEVELVIVIGKEGRDIPLDKAKEHILGYTIGNDVSQRTWQMQRGGTQFGVGKMFDTFAPVGPAIVSPDAVPDISNLRVYSSVNGDVRQDSNTDDMIFTCDEIVSFVSIGTTLRPGDMIFTGTPSGVAVGLPDEPYLKDGDEVFFHIDKLGELKNKVVFEKADQEIIKRWE